MDRLRTTGWLAAVVVTGMAGVAIMACKKVNAESGPTVGAAATDAPAVSAARRTADGPGLPADFPLAPGLAPCRPIVTGPEVTCDWHGADGHSVYQFYAAALPKAGYTILPGAGESTSPSEFGAIGFSKGDVKGAITVRQGDVTVQVFYGNGN